MLKTVFKLRILKVEESVIKISISEIESFCNMITVFTVTFDQFMASLLNKIIHFFQKKILLTPQL